MALASEMSQPQARTPFANTTEHPESEPTTVNGSRLSSLPRSSVDEKKGQLQEYNGANGANGSNEGKRELTEEDCEDQLAFAYPTWYKWYILSVIFLVQVSMNFNTSLYSNGIGGISKKFGVSEQAARAGAAIFLITYAFG